MATLKELRNVRIEKLKTLRSMGIDPYPAVSYKDTICADIESKFDTLNGKTVNVSGRVMSLRGHGKLLFADIKEY